MLGDEKCIKFWEDKWVEEIVLKEEYPRLFNISTCKESLVSDLMDQGLRTSSDRHSWKLGWRRERFV